MKLHLHLIFSVSRWETSLPIIDREPELEMLVKSKCQVVYICLQHWLESLREME